MDIENLQHKCTSNPAKKLIAGFDGFVDTIAKVIAKTATSNSEIEYYDNMKDFGEYIANQSGKSCSIELDIKSKKIGGNAPILANAACSLGMDVSCIGMLGEHEIHSVFSNMPCSLYSFTAYGESTALEFTDGKVLLAPGTKLPRDPWDMVMQATENKAVNLFCEADVLALLNWSELEFSHSLWESTYKNAIAIEKANKLKYAFFDLSDCTRKSTEEITNVLKLIGEFSEFRTTILSLNENEAQVINNRIAGNLPDESSLSNKLREIFGIDEILIHTLKQSILASERGVVIKDSIFVSAPLVSTGAGDNFNAASCFAAVMGLNDSQRLDFANKFVNLYLINGFSPSISNML